MHCTEQPPRLASLPFPGVVCVPYPLLTLCPAAPRYYGTVFTLFFTIVGGGAILANVVWQFYTIIVAPVNKHSKHPPAHSKPALTPQDSRSYPDAEATRTESSPAAKSQPSMYQKLLGILRPTSSDKHTA